LDLNDTPEQARFRAEARAWLEDHKIEAPPRSRSYEDNGHLAARRDWQRKLAEAGLAGVTWPEEFGGRGLGAIEQVTANQEISRAGVPGILDVIGIGMLGPCLIAHGSEEQKTRYLGPMLHGDEVWCQGFSEPNAGSDLANLSTEARLEDGYFVVNGQKVWTSFGWAADWCELVARTDASAAKHSGLTVLLVDMRSPGVEVRPLRQMTGESEFNELFFHDVRVPAENVLGAVNDGWNVALGTLMHERATLGAGLHVLYKRQFERLVDLANTIDRHGAPASRDPVLRQKLAQIYSEIEIMRLNQMRSISRVGRNGTPGPESSLQKLFWSELNQRFQQVAQEVLGPFAQLEKGSEFAFDEGQWAYSYLRARGNTIEAGTSEIQRNIIGHFVLGLPRSY